MSEKDFILYDPVKEIQKIGEFSGSIISKCNDKYDSVVFSDNLILEEDRIKSSQALMVGFEVEDNKKIAFSRKVDLECDMKGEDSLRYSIMIPKEIMHQYDEGQFSDAFPFTINLLHTAGLFLNDHRYKINHLDFFKGEILKNPVAVIHNGMCVADRVVIDHRGDPVFYDCLIVGRGKDEQLSVSYEPLANVDDRVVEYIIILGIEELKL